MVNTINDISSSLADCADVPINYKLACIYIQNQERVVYGSGLLGCHQGARHYTLCLSLWGLREDKWGTVNTRKWSSLWQRRLNHLGLGGISSRHRIVVLPKQDSSNTKWTRILGSLRPLVAHPAALISVAGIGCRRQGRVHGVPKDDGVWATSSSSTATSLSTRVEFRAARSMVVL